MPETSIGATNIAQAARQLANSQQGVGPGAEPRNIQVVPSVAVFTDGDVSDEGLGQQQERLDWRVSLSLPPFLRDNPGPILEPLVKTNNRMIFPFTPTILFQHTSNYTTIAPTHSNYPFHAYQNSQVNDITITATFVNENQEDGRYYIAVLHFLRTMTKMFYGNESEHQGNPPMISRLNGYGPHVLNNIPVVLTNFSMDLPQEVDYIECKVNEDFDYVPTESIITVTCAPNYSRRLTSQFNLRDYADGKLKGQGFI